MPLRLALAYGVIALSLVALAGAVGAGVALLGRSVYAARAEIFYPLSSDRAVGFLREDRRLATQLAIVESRELLVPIGRELRLEYPLLVRMVDASIEGQTEVVRIDVRDADPARALRVLDRIVTTYLAGARRKGGQAPASLIQPEIARIERRLGAIDRALRRIDLDRPFAVAGAEPSAQQAALLAENATLLARLAQLRADLLASRIAISNREQPALLAAPHVLEGRVEPRPIRSGAIGALAGIAVALGLICLLERGRRRLGEQGS